MKDSEILCWFPQKEISIKYFKKLNPSIFLCTFKRLLEKQMYYATIKKIPEKIY